MKLNIPKIFEQVHLNEYAAELGGNVLLVWLNPPREVLQEKEDHLNAYLRQNGEIAEKRRTLKREALTDVEKALQEARDVLNGEEKPEETTQALDAEALNTALAELDQQATDALYAFNRDVLGWWAKIWSQGDDPALHWTVDELLALDKEDPQFLVFMIARADDKLKEHREHAKKVSRMR